ncbi:hypothetical protein BC830DRAFT_377630 [Chytriomyces sp. MP71]|nr:hypothetical protein BC830DRAFT_377630 [Chytriomyces sp. MP71]
MSLYDGNPAYPTAVAQNIWDLFLGGYSNFRPFGNSVVLDGVDLHIWNNNLDGVSDLVSALTKLMQGYYILSASPRCQFPDYIFNPTTFPHFTSNFSYIVPYFLGSPNICGFAGNNPGGFWSTLDQWNSWLNGSMFQTPPSSMPMYLGLADWPVEAWDQATTGDYISPVAFVEQDLITRLKSHSNFAGFALQDASYDSNNHPCVNDPPKSKRTYSQFLYKQLTLPLNETGKFTSDKYMCLDKVPKTTSSSMKKTTTKPVKNAETGTPTTSHANRSVTALFFLFGFLISFLF